MVKNKRNSIISFSIFIFLIFFIQIVSPDDEWTTEYNETTRVITIFDEDGEIITQIKLVTELIHKVFYGKDRRVAELEFFNYDEDILDSLEELGEMEFHEDDEDGAIMIRNFTYKYKNVSIGNITDSEWVCNPYDSGNGTGGVHPNCTLIIGSHLGEIFEWIDITDDFDFEDIVDASNETAPNITIGIFTEVFVEETIEWLPTFFEILLDEWAVWTEDFNTNLTAYWTLNETTGVAVDSLLYKHNGTVLGSVTRGVDGIIGEAYDFDGGNVTIENLIYDENKDFVASASMWINTSSSPETKYFFGGSARGGVGDAGITGTTNVNDSLWHHVVIVTNDSSRHTLYIDGAIEDTASFGASFRGLALFIQEQTVRMSQRDDNSSRIIIGGSDVGLSFPDLVDEVAYWEDRMLTPDEVVDLYNNGLGITFSTNITATINFPENRVYSSDDLPLNFNVSLSREGSVQYSLDEGVINITMFTTSNPSEKSGTLFNATNDSIADAVYNFRVFANSTLGRVDNSQNITFTFDSTFPNITIESITTTQGSQTISFNVTIEEINQGNCFYSIFDAPSGGVNGTNNNQSFTCANNTLVSGKTVTAFATYKLFVYINDTAGNLNQTNQTFTTTASPGGGGGGSGGSGGGGLPTQLIPVIGLLVNNTEKDYNPLEKEVAYALINNFCGEKISNEPLALEDFLCFK